MYTYKIYNNIAEDGIEILTKNNLHIDEINPDSLLVPAPALPMHFSDLLKSLSLSTWLLINNESGFISSI